MAALIDASILIAHERGKLDVETQIASRQGEQFYVSIVTASELLHGVHRAIQPEIREKRSRFVEGVLAKFPLLDLDLPTARVHARLWAELAVAGAIIGPHDLWLAAACLTHGLTMVTANVREFNRVPGLTVECWVKSA